MKAILRYRTSKPTDGHFSFQLTDNATVLAYSEHWHTEKGWELLMDVLEDSREQKARRYFFLCNAGDPLDFLGEHPDLYFVGRHEAKAYTSFLFETTHLSETERARGRIDSKRFTRPKPRFDELSRTEQAIALRAGQRPNGVKGGTEG